ncbi:hypothetical protein H6G54_00790 [Anabaena cylindrica FACHB-243]|uniref:Uncharacterized protein n=1 Tax=Anabaena cylindrica (strain ATCC 27899 / PCC 7122) TaxID=272123 RepID=K9ZJH0_ANACC|nr:MULTISPECIES: hypothetical protein [Anabaena]AFZ59383.1 hypothetical protein Anacy_4013 [Anabaena cylindrica PCC 7122]MBD2416273.1 hypothetical protein [Anabaena cylindrica FACHB-243]MBY5280235.1 hypothetical protein [Anabaena sp. CCAP 1446/1C]MBY5308507.1 hypothetical protein [Anabaena sp. CCAP 1446/1C]MCM2405301.1 hypothetical protein [Anabaena sp. CCAP 1446/1C]
MASPRRPLTGQRLIYEIQMGGVGYRVRIKESIANLLGLKPATTGQTGTFGASGLPVIPGIGGGNIGRKYLKAPPGFRFQSYKFLVVPGTKVKEPIPGCNTAGTRTREICSFSIGFPKGVKETPITRWRVSSWARSKPVIIGMITPSGVQHLWKGKLSNNPIDPSNLPDLPDFDLGGLIDAGRTLLPLLL